MIISESHIRKVIKETMTFRNPGFGGESFTSVLLAGDGHGTTISKDIKWGDGEAAEKRKLAWLYLRQFLPDKSVLTSCFRIQADQNRIIVNFAKKLGYGGAEGDLDAMHILIKSSGLVVARHVGRGHGGKGDTGAFDVSGANLDQIWRGVLAANSAEDDIAKFNLLDGDGSIIERNNNAVHIQFDLADVDLSKKGLLSIEPDDEEVASEHNTDRHDVKVNPYGRIDVNIKDRKVSVLKYYVTFPESNERKTVLMSPRAGTTGPIYVRKSGDEGEGIDLTVNFDKLSSGTDYDRIKSAINPESDPPRT